MMKRFIAGACIYFLISNFAYLFAQGEVVSDPMEPVDLVEETVPDTGRPSEPDTIKTLSAEQDSLPVPQISEAPMDTVLFSQEQELPKKGFKGTGKDVILAAVSIVGWLFFMWVTANTRE
jgi:hypothetical protein